KRSEDLLPRSVLPSGVGWSEFAISAGQHRCLCRLSLLVVLALLQQSLQSRLVPESALLFLRSHLFVQAQVLHEVATAFSSHRHLKAPQLGAVIWDRS